MMRLSFSGLQFLKLDFLYLNLKELLMSNDKDAVFGMQLGIIVGFLGWLIILLFKQAN